MMEVRHTFSANDMSSSRLLRQTNVQDRDTFNSMKTKKLTEILERIEAWPPETQNQLADFALELDAGLSDDIYEPTPEELAGIERGLRAAAEGRFATDQQVEAVFAKFRGK
jgi:hypothetical protein